MILSLLKVRFAAMFAAMTSKGANGKRRGIGTIILFAVIYLYVGACMFGMFFGLFFSIAPVVFGAGIGWVLYGIAGILAFALPLFLSVLSVKAQLYEAKDNELLLSMPVPPYAILVSRFIYLYITTLIYELIVLLPAAVAVILTGNASVPGLILFFIASLLLPLLTLTVAGILAWLIALVSSRTTRKSLITIVMSLAFLAVYFYFIQNSDAIVTLLKNNIGNIGAALSNYYTPIYAFGTMATGNLISFFIFAAWCIVPFAIISYIISTSFIAILTRKTGVTRAKYRERSLKTASASSALLRKELTRFFSSAIYFMNCGIGSIMLLIAAVLLVIKGGDLSALEVTEGFSADIALKTVILCVMPSAMMFCGATAAVTAPSISLEGRSIGVVQTIPVSGTEVLLAKVWAHMIICLPAQFIFAVVAGIVFSADVVSFILLLLLSVSSTFFIAFLGIIANLRYPKLEWINEAVPVKQGWSVGIVMLSGMGIAMVMAATCVVSAILLYAWVGLLVWNIVFALFSYIMYRYVCGKGGRKFETLA